MEATSTTPIPDFGQRRALSIRELAGIEQPALIIEGCDRMPDEPPRWFYTVVGLVDGENIATEEGGATFDGDAIVVFAKTREEADEIAYAGLHDTVVLCQAEALREEKAKAAMRRLSQLNPMQRLQMGMANDNGDFRRDADLIRAAGFGHELGVKRRTH